MTVGIWVVVAVLGVGVGAAAVVARRRSGDVEPTVREFAAFRDALSRQVDATAADTATTRRHLDRVAHVDVPKRSGSTDTRG